MFGAISALTLALIWSARFLPGGAQVPGLISIGSLVQGPGLPNFESPRNKRCRGKYRTHLHQDHATATSVDVEITDSRREVRRALRHVHRHDHKHKIHKHKIRKHVRKRSRCRSKARSDVRSSRPMPPAPPAAPVPPTAPTPPTPPIPPTLAGS